MVNHMIISDPLLIPMISKTLPTTDPLVPELKSIEYVSIFLTNVYSRSSNLIPKGKPGFGFLSPRYGNVWKNPDALLGTIYDSDIENNVEGLFVDTKPVHNPNNKNHHYDGWSLLYKLDNSFEFSEFENC